jgi:hypothetical protein
LCAKELRIQLACIARHWFWYVGRGEHGFPDVFVKTFLANGFHAHVEATPPVFRCLSGFGAARRASAAARRDGCIGDADPPCILARYSNGNDEWVRQIVGYVPDTGEALTAAQIDQLCRF